MSDEIDKQVEIQKMLLFLTGCGIMMFGVKMINLYKSSFIVLIATTILNIISESEKEVSIKLDSKMMPKYVTTLFYVLVLVFYYRLYRKYEINIHQLNTRGDFKKYEKHILYILLFILVIELLFVINSNKNGSTEIIGISFILYLLTLRLIIIGANMYKRLRHRKPVRSSEMLYNLDLL